MTAETAALPPPPPYERLLAGMKPLLILFGIAAAVAAGVTVVLWSQGPSYSLLFGNLAMEDQAQIAQALEAADIPYRLDLNTNAIHVPSDRVSEARLKLAGQGLPESKSGFDLMTKDSGLGLSQFMESARYHHALESELARTIASLRPVEGARVHLAVPRQSAFVRDRRPPSASVFVQLKPGRRLEQQQVQAIVNLVASSIPELEAQNVTVVDQQGRLLSSPKGADDFSLREQHFDLVHRLEEEYAQRIESLLTPLVGPGRVRAQVVAQIETAVTEEARELYRPESQVVRSEAVSEQISRDNTGPQGVPGSLTNQPPAPGVVLPPNAAPATAAAANTTTTDAAAATPENVSRQSTRNYEIDRTIAYTRQPPGRVKRLTVAVLVDNVRTVGKDGKTVEKPLTPEQLAHVTQLVKDAVGYDESRGDSVNVVNASFEGEQLPTDGKIEDVPFWELPLFRDLLKLLAGLIILLVLVLAVLRPLIKSLFPAPRAPEPLPQPVTGELMPPSSESDMDTGVLKPLGELSYEQQLANARALVAQDPKRVAQVVRTWVAEDE